MRVLIDDSYLLQSKKEHQKESYLLRMTRQVAESSKLHSEQDSRGLTSNSSAVLVCDCVATHLTLQSVSTT